MTDRAALLQEILANSPDDAFARYGLALEYANSGQTEDALREFATLREKNPDYVPAYQMAAQTLMLESRHDEARTILEQGIAAAQRTRNQHAEKEMQGMLFDLG
jgi:tetratricopeptide (TPR) repeat protein